MHMHPGLDLAADVELVTVEDNVLLRDQQDLLAGMCGQWSALVWPPLCHLKIALVIFLAALHSQCIF